MRLHELRAVYDDFFDPNLRKWAYTQSPTSHELSRSQLRIVRPKKSVSILYRVVKGELTKRAPRVFAKTPDIIDNPASDGDQIVELFCLQLFKKAGIDFLVAPAILAHVKQNHADASPILVSFAPTGSDMDMNDIPVDTVNAEKLKQVISAFSAIYVARLMIRDGDLNPANDRFEPTHQLLFGIDFDPAYDPNEPITTDKITKSWPHSIQLKLTLSDCKYALWDISKRTKTPSLDMNIVKDTVLAFCAIPDTEVQSLLEQFSTTFSSPTLVKKLQYISHGFLTARQTLQRMVMGPPDENQFLSFALKP